MERSGLSQVSARRQSGVVLFVALIVLVAMSFAGLAIMRSVGSGVLIASNLAFKQTTTAGAERGIEAARAWLLAQSVGTLVNDNTAAGYYSSWSTFNPITFNWNVGTASLAADGAGTSIRFVVHRLCQTPNLPHNDPGQQCITKAVPTGGGAGSSTGGVAYGTVNLKFTQTPYYRVTVRSSGPKNAVSYVQVIFD